MTIDIYIILITALAIYCIVSYLMIIGLHRRIESLEEKIQKVAKQNPRNRR